MQRGCQNKREAEGMTQVPVRAHPNDDAFDIIANKACPPAVQFNRPDNAEEMSLCRDEDVTVAACRALSRKR